MKPERKPAFAPLRIPVEPGVLFERQPLVAFEVAEGEDGKGTLIYVHLTDGRIMTLSLTPGEPVYSQIHDLGHPPYAPIH